jgi:hypothetical protein
MNSTKIIAIVLGVMALAIADLKAWNARPLKRDGRREPFDFWTAAPRWILGGIAGDAVSNHLPA